MINVASAKINSFASAPQNKSVSSDDPILEVPLSELQSLLNEMLLTHNELAELVRDSGILRGRELARITEDHARAMKAERSPTTKLMLLNAYIRQFLTRIRDALKSRPAEGGKVVQVVSKIAARAIQIIEYVKAISQDSPRKEIALDSQQVRILFSGASKEKVSRKDTIRAMRRAEALWPALQCGHRPNDGRGTTRITAKVEELQDSPIMGYRDLWKRSNRDVTLSM